MTSTTVVGASASTTTADLEQHRDDDRQVQARIAEETESPQGVPATPTGQREGQLRERQDAKDRRPSALEVLRIAAVRDMKSQRAGRGDDRAVEQDR